MKSFCKTVLVFILLAGVSAAQSLLTGSVNDEKGQPLYAANVYIESVGVGTATNLSGEFTISIPSSPDSVTIRVSYIGYITKYLSIALPAEVPPVISMEPDYIRLGDVVISETRESAYLKDSPVKIEVIPRREIDRLFAVDFTEVCEFTPGVKVQNNCGVCGTTDIRINGLEGQYTQMLINGFPIVSSLGTVYGLMGINASNIKQIEIVRGPGSILFGPEAVAGTINILLKNPSNLPGLMVSGSLTDYQKSLLSVTGNMRRGNVASSLTADYSFNKRRIDINRDNFTDAPLFERFSVINQWMADLGNSSVYLFGRYYYEDRFGGEMGWKQNLHRGGTKVYGESVFTNRFELLGGYMHHISPASDLKINISGSAHNQDSYYGSNYYYGDQKIAYGDVIFTQRRGVLTTYSAGAALKYEYYDDNTPATASPVNTQINSPSENAVYSAFFQAEHRFSDLISALAGIRYNYHSVHKSILQPRLSLRLDLSESSSLRISGGTGFRNVNIFTEDHSALTGAREVVIQSDLKPEKSINGSATFVQDLDFGNQYARIEVNAHYTRFSDKILPDYNTDQTKIIYKNSAGYTISNGVSLSFEYQFLFPARLKLSYDFLDTYTMEENVRKETEFNPGHSFNVLADYDFESIPLEINISGKITGAQKMPEITGEFARPLYSPAYSVWDAKLTWSYSRVKIFAGINNLFDYTQDSPLIDPGNPFGDNFDTIYIYGPILGREFILGFDIEI